MRKRIIWPSIFFCCFFLCQNLIAQVKKVTVKGIILDAATKESQPGITVGTPGKGLTQADANGKYSVVVDDGATLVFSGVGYITQSIKLKPGQVTLNVNLATDSKMINETVIRGYVKRTREETTGSSFIVSGKEVQDNPVGNVEELLQGKVAGLNIQNNTGAPGMRGTVNIRGLSTISTTGSGENTFLQPTSPLYVIDGVPMDADQASQYGFDQQGSGVSPLSLIPQEDIASIEVLKDATATALYGSRGAYGVILIQTIRGKSKTPKIYYTANYFWQAIPKLRETLGGDAERAFKIAQIEKYGTYSDRYILSNTPFLADSLNPYYNNSTNWQSIFYYNRLNMTQNVRLDGGDPIFNYKVNLKYYSQNGIVANTGNENYSLDMNMMFNPSKRLTFQGSLRTGINKVKSGSGSGVLQNLVGSSGNKSTLQPGPSFLLATSDVLTTLNIRESSGPREIHANMTADYELVPGLHLGANGAYDYTIDNQDKFYPAASNAQFAKLYNFYGYTSNIYNRNSVTYTKAIGDHNLFFNVFSEIYIKKQQQVSTQIQRSPNDQFEGPLGYDGSLSSGGGVISSNFGDLKTAALAAQFTYDYKKKYVLDLVYRLDGSSTNGNADPFHKNPSIGFRWNAYKESWIANNTSKWLDYLAFRLTAGQNVYPVGSLSDIYGQYNPNGFYDNQARVGIDYGKVPNPNLKARNVIQYNFGFDAGFLNDKLSIIFDTYYKAVSNDLFDNRLSNTLAFGTYTSNDASLVDYGYELTLTGRPLSKSSKLQWTISVNGALNFDVLTKLPTQYNGQYIDIADPTALDQTGQYVVKRVGRNALSNYLYINQGVFSTTANVPVDPVTGLRLRNVNIGNFTLPSTPLSSYQGGDARLYDANNDYVIDFRDRQISGNTQPLVTGGLTNTFTYNQFSLNIFATYTAVRSVLNNALAARLLLLSNPFGTSSVPPPGSLRIWTGPGDANAKYANVYNYAHDVYVQNFRTEQTLWQESGSYFKINQVTLKYGFNKDFVKRLGLGNLAVYISTNNLIVFSPYSGPNPENVNSLGKDTSSGYPNPHQYTLGMNVTF